VTKICKNCFQCKSEDQFTIRLDCQLGLHPMCRECKNRKSRLENGKDRYKKHSKICKKYEKTIGGYLMRMYRNMLSLLQLRR